MSDTIISEIEELQNELREHDAKKPAPPLARIAELLEPTTPALLDAFANRSRCIGVISHEGGSYMSGHASKAETVISDKATKNIAWDGGTIGSERRSVESVMVDTPRLTLALAVQPAVNDRVQQNTGNIGRAIGEAARFLFACPQTTQGTRAFREAAAMPSLDAFAKRLRELLDMDLTYDGSEARRLAPPSLPFTPEAKAEWVEFYNDIEAELAPGGDVADARDVASKAAENAARLAAIFHVFDHGPHGSIGLDETRAAIRLMTWHLYQARDYFSIAAPAPSVANAIKLEAWLLRRLRATGEAQVKTKDILNAGPGAVRHRAELDAALAELTKRHRVRVFTLKGGRTQLVELGPRVATEAQ